MKAPILCKFNSILIMIILFSWSAVGICSPLAQNYQEILEPSTLKRLFDPIEIEAKHFELLLGHKLSGLKLFALNSGEELVFDYGSENDAESKKFMNQSSKGLRIIRFQIDERTEKMEMMLTDGPPKKLVSGNGVLDPQDILVFMTSSVGDRIKPEVLKLVSQYIVEIELTDPVDGGSGYVYLAENPKNMLPSVKMPGAGLIDGSQEDSTLGVKAGSFKVTCRNNIVNGKLYKTPIYDHWYHLKRAGGNEKNLFDTMKVRIKARALFGILKITLDETNIVGGIETYRNVDSSMVRGYAQYWVQAILPFGLKSPKALMDVYVYDSWVLVPSQIKIPVDPGYLITDFQVTFGYDLNQNAKGMKFYNSNNLEGFLIDGKMDEAEKQMNTDDDKWRAIVGPQGTMITASVWDKSYKAQVENISIHYVDDVNKEFPPDNEPGSMGFQYTHSQMKSLDSGTYNMLLCWLYPPNMYDPKQFRMEIIEEFLNVRRKPIQITVNGRQFDNPGGWPPIIKPMN